MAFKSVLSVTGADHSDQDVKTAAGLCAEVGAYLSVLIMSPPRLVMSPPPLGDGIPEWPRCELSEGCPFGPHRGDWSYQASASIGGSE